MVAKLGLGRSQSLTAGDRSDNRDRERYRADDAHQDDHLRDTVRCRLLTIRNRLLDVRRMRPRMVSAVRGIVDAGARDSDRLANSFAADSPGKIDTRR
jgi:hypothetical protein